MVIVPDSRNNSVTVPPWKDHGILELLIEEGQMWLNESDSLYSLGIFLEKFGSYWRFKTDGWTFRVDEISSPLILQWQFESSMLAPSTHNSNKRYGTSYPSLCTRKNLTISKSNERKIDIKEFQKTLWFVTTISASTERNQNRPTD